jgi:hypothetical protein
MVSGSHKATTDVASFPTEMATGKADMQLKPRRGKEPNRRHGYWTAPAQGHDPEEGRPLVGRRNYDDGTRRS